MAVAFTSEEKVPTARTLLDTDVLVTDSLYRRLLTQPEELDAVNRFAPVYEQVLEATVRTLARGMLR